MRTNSKINFSEKAGLVIFSIVGCLFLVLGFLNIKSRLFAPFKLEARMTIKSAEQNLEDLKLKDTDQDGLTDYDETFLYNTSSYIADSDSDGDTDSAEIKANTDPNCPKGKTCVVEETSPAPASVSPEPGSLDLSKTLGGLEAGAAPTATILRDALIQAGVDAVTLEKISDADLLKLYEETAKEQQ